MRHRLVLVSLAALLVTGTLAGAARAQTPNPQRQRELKDRILEATASEAAALEELQALRDRKAPIDARVAELDGAMGAVLARLAPLEAEVARISAALEDAQRQFLARQAEFEAAKAEFDGSAAQIYRSARRGVTYDYVAAARPENLVQGSKYLDEVNAKQRLTVRHIVELRDAVDAQRKDIAQKKTDAEAAAAEVAKLRDEVARLRAEIEPARAQAATEVKNEESLIASLRSQKQQWEREWAELQAVSDSIAAQLRLNPTPGSPAGSCEFRPVPGQIVSGFGLRQDPLGSGTGNHAGLDIAAPSGTPIRACRGGKVIISGWQGGYGQAVVVDHGGGMATLYAHQSRLGVGVGETVLPGEVIGYVGSTGQSTGPHLHFEVRISGTPVNPTSYL